MGIPVGAAAVLDQHETWQISQNKKIKTNRWTAWRSITTGRVSKWGHVLKEILLDQGILVEPWRYRTRDEKPRRSPARAGKRIQRGP